MAAREPTDTLAALYKRDRDELDDGEISDHERPDAKRPKKLAGAPPRHQHQSFAIDATWGQKSVFSGTEDATSIPCGDESDFEDDAEAMAYLRDVRLQASSMPHLLVARAKRIGPRLPKELQRPRQADDDTGSESSDSRDSRPRRRVVKDARAYYDGGAYVARPTHSQHIPADSGPEASRRLDEAYFASIMDKYRRLRRSLHSRPPPGTQLAYGLPTSAQPPSATKIWSKVIRSADPHSVQLAHMSKRSVLCVLRIIAGGKLIRPGYTLTERTSRWLWALLARLPELGELSNTEVGWLRDLGRLVVFLGRPDDELDALRAELPDSFWCAGPTHQANAAEDGSRDDVADGARDGAIDTFEEGDIDEAKDGDHGSGVVEKDYVDEDADDSGSVDMDMSSDLAAGDDCQGDAGTLEAAKQALLSWLDHAAPARALGEDPPERLSINRRVTIDMVLTVLGKFYGQKDMLEWREPFMGL